MVLGTQNSGENASFNRTSRIRVEICKIPGPLFVPECFLWPAAPPCRARLVLVIMWLPYSNMLPGPVKPKARTSGFAQVRNETVEELWAEGLPTLSGG